MKIPASYQKPLLFLLFVALLFASAGCTKNVSEIPVGEEVVIEQTTFSFDQDKHPYELFPEYKLAPGDVLDVLFQIRTWVEKKEFKLAIDHTIQINFIHAPELSLEQRVRPDGTISLPYLGVIRVIGKTVEEFTEELKEAYSKVLKNPDLYVLVPDFRASIKELKYDLHTAPRGLSRLVTIRPDGYVTFPMVGDSYVVGRTIPEVNRDLNNQYEQILPDLHCDLFLEKHSGTVIYVVGQVRAPGSYSIVKPITVGQALALAGSVGPGANLENVIVARRHEGKIVATRVDLRNNIDLATEGKFFILQPDDIVWVPRTRIAEAAEVAAYIGEIIFFRGWSTGLGFSWELHDAPETDKGHF